MVLDDRSAGKSSSPTGTGALHRVAKAVHPEVLAERHPRHLADGVGRRTWPPFPALHPRCRVHGRAEVVAVPFLGLAQVQAHPATQCRPRPVGRAERARCARPPRRARRPPERTPRPGRHRLRARHRPKLPDRRAQDVVAATSTTPPSCRGRRPGACVDPSMSVNRNVTVPVGPVSLTARRLRTFQCRRIDVRPATSIGTPARLHAFGRRRRHHRRP